MDFFSSQNTSSIFHNSAGWAGGLEVPEKTKQKMRMMHQIPNHKTMKWLRQVECKLLFKRHTFLLTHKWEQNRFYWTVLIQLAQL